MAEIRMRLMDFASQRYVSVSDAMLDRFPVKPEIVMQECLLAESKVWRMMLRSRLPVHDLCSYKWPLTWWDAVKARFFPKWALRRFPIRYDGVDLVQVADVALPMEFGKRYHTFFHLENTAGVSAGLDFENVN
jgi:hypothetical protein